MSVCKPGMAGCLVEMFGFVRYSYDEFTPFSTRDFHTAPESATNPHSHNMPNVFAYNQALN